MSTFIHSIFHTIQRTGKCLGLQKISYLRHGYDAILQMTLPFTARIQGSRMKPASVRMYLRGAHEPGTTALCRRIIQKGWTVLDVGAQDGYFTLLFSRLVGDRGRVFAFEAIAGNAANVAANVARNQYRNITAVNKAVSDQSGRARFFTGTNRGVGSLFYDSGRKEKHTEVETITLDDYFRATPFSIDFFKMDIEGAEHAALAGMREVIARSRGAGKKLSGVVEFAPFMLEHIGIKPEAFLDELRAADFSFSRIHEDGGVETVLDEELIAYARSARHINLFCVLRGA